MEEQKPLIEIFCGKYKISPYQVVDGKPTIWIDNDNGGEGMEIGEEIMDKIWKENY